VAAAGLRLAQPSLDGQTVYWLEGRPAEGGRQVLVRAEPGAEPRDVSSEVTNVRTRVHEYGGGDYLVRGGRVFSVDFADQRLRSTGPEGEILLSQPGPRYADFDLSPDGAWLVAVEERPRTDGEPENRIVVLPARGGAPARCVAAGHDFVSFPRFSPDGSRLVFTAWEHPSMPWDQTRLFELDWGAEGPAGEARPVAGGPGESIFQPCFSPGGVLTFVSDRSGWWNLYQLAGGKLRALCPREAEFGLPQWVFGMSTYAYLDEDHILCRYTARGGDRLARLHLRSGGLEEIELPFSSIQAVRAQAGRACLLAAGPTRAQEIAVLDPWSGALETLRSSFSVELDPDWISIPEEIEFPSAGGRPARAYFYPPHNPGASEPEGELPPLLVKSHGGPSSATSSALDLKIQYWTSRGFAVVDVNYAGSTGYGRAYRELLRGQWGVRDVEDCIAAALHLAERGRVDRERMAISGGSAGGNTTLCALTFHDVFRAGASHYGIGDLEALQRDTHKFESHYNEGLVAPYPEGRDLYRARSPIHFTDRLSCPVIFFQGLEDRVVPPSQAEAMVEALARRGIPHAYVTFPGEQHGFRRAENIATALDGELYFYSRVFGFQAEVHPEAVRIVG
jgi:dipeptidyl aminopeptidase/acylaminoacyl peptidase